MRHIPTALLAATLAVFGASSRATPIRYDCQRLADPGDGDGAVPLAINQKGAIAGYSGFVTPWGYQAVTWAADGGYDVLPPSSVDSELTMAADLNDKGQAVGYGYGRGGHFRAVGWKKGGPARILPPLTGGARSGAAVAINNQGDIVGYSGAPDASSTSHATLWRGGLAFDLGTLGGAGHQLQRESRANDLNDAGVIVGESQVDSAGPAHAVRWDTPKRIVDLGTLPGGAGSSASAINFGGTVVGQSDDAAGARLPVAWTSNGIHALGLPAGHVGGQVWAVNDQDAMVGQSGRSGTDSHAVVWFGIDGAPAQLDELVEGGCVDAGGKAAPLTSAYGINNAGTIAAVSRTYQGGQFVTTAFRLTPR